MAGQGTVALELIEQVGKLDLLLTPVGGVGLLSGCITALTGACRAVGVEPEAGNDGQQSLARGEIVRIETPPTIADAAQSRSLGQLTFPVLHKWGAHIPTVSDMQIVQTMKFLPERMKLVVEPTGCLAAAAALHGAVDVRGLRVVDLARFAALTGAP